MINTKYISLLFVLLFAFSTAFSQVHKIEKAATKIELKKYDIELKKIERENAPTIGREH